MGKELRMRGRVSVGSHPTSNCFQKFESRAPAKASQVGGTARQIEYASLKDHGMAMRFNGNRKKFLANCLILSHNIISTAVGLVCVEVEEIQFNVPPADQAFWRVWFMILKYVQHYPSTLF